MSIGNWPTSDIALPTTETPATGPSGSRPPLPNAIPIATLPIWQETDNPEENPVFRMGVAIALVFVPLGICIAGFLTWKHFNREEPEIPRRPTIAIPREPASIPDAPAPSTLVLNENTAPLPAEIRPPLPTENNTITLSPPKTAGEASLARPNPPSTFSTTLAPGVTANVEGEVSSVAASPAFRAFVASVKISGVFQGASGRAFLNGRMTRVGETVDSRHGIILENIDVDKKHLVFKDASGAIVTRKY